MIITQLENKILNICFDRKDKMNAITDAMYLDAEKALLKQGYAKELEQRIVKKLAT